MTNNSHNSRQDAQGSTGRGATEPSQSGLRPIDMAGLYHEVRSSLMHFAARYFRRPQEIEDVVQEAFVKVIEAQRSRTIHAPKSYLYRTTRNLALKQLDKSAHKLTDTMGELLPDTPLLHSRTLEEDFESSEKFELFCRAVRQLPVKCQRVYILRKVYGYSQQEIAQHMDISIKTVEAHLTKAIVRCTDYMDNEMAPEANPAQTDPRRSNHV